MAMRRPEPGFWTYEDLLAMPEDGRRYEIVEGVLWEMTGPSSPHAVSVRNLIALLLPIFAARRMEWFTAPLDVFFAGANPVQPDLLACVRGGATVRSQRGIEGAPDFVVEVLSPSTRGHDGLTKRALYGWAVVREYWLVDPDARTVEILALDGEVLRHAWSGSGEDVMRSGLLPDAAFSVAAVFAEPDLG